MWINCKQTINIKYQALTGLRDKIGKCRMQQIWYGTLRVKSLCLVPCILSKAVDFQLFISLPTW